MNAPVCPCCERPFSIERFEGHYGATVVLDLCHSCELIWFDKLENVQLSAGGVLALLRSMSQGLDAARAVLPDQMGCPRCDAPLRRELRRGKTPGVSWQVQRCPKGHGQLVRYLDYLTERDCVRPLDPARLDELRQHVQQIRCSGCGASVDLEKHAACTHCGANLSVLDAAATADALARLTEERERKDKIINPQELAAVLEVDRLRAEQHSRRMDRIYTSRGSGEIVLTGLVEAGLALLFGLLE